MIVAIPPTGSPRWAFAFSGSVIAPVMLGGDRCRKCPRLKGRRVVGVADLEPAIVALDDVSGDDGRACGGVGHDAHPVLCRSISEKGLGGGPETL